MRIWITPKQAAEAIATGKGKGIRIAILDSGVEASHPNLAGLRLCDDLAIVESEHTGWK